MNPIEARSMLAKIRDNQDKLFGCKAHAFGDIAPPYEFGAVWKCQNCGGDMKALDAFRYIQGYEAAGGNPNDVLNGWKVDWKPVNEDQAEGTLQRQYWNEQGMIDWVVSRWNAEVANRPLINVHRRSLDDTWRQVLRHLGADDRKLIGPTHDELLFGN